MTEIDKRRSQKAEEDRDRRREKPGGSKGSLSTKAEARRLRRTTIVERRSQEAELLSKPKENYQSKQTIIATREKRLSRKQ